MLVQDPSCCNGALRVPDHLKLEEKFDLIIAVVLLILSFSSSFFFFLKGLLCKEKRYLFCFSNFSEVDIFGTESLRYWRKTLTNVDADEAILAYLYLVNRLSNLGNTYSCFKTREIRKLTICQRHTLKVLQN